MKKIFFTTLIAFSIATTVFALNTNNIPRADTMTFSLPDKTKHLEVYVSEKNGSFPSVPNNIIMDITRGGSSSMIIRKNDTGGYQATFDDKYQTSNYLILGYDADGQVVYEGRVGPHQVEPASVEFFTPNADVAIVRTSLDGRQLSDPEIIPREKFDELQSEEKILPFTGYLGPYFYNPLSTDPQARYEFSTAGRIVQQTIK